MQHQKWNEHYDLITQELQRAFPKTFPEKPNDKVALAVGIQRHVIQWGKEHGYTEHDIKEVLYWWTRGNRYITALRNAEKNHERYGIRKLNGQWLDGVIQREYPVEFTATVTRHGKWFGYDLGGARAACTQSALKFLRKAGFKVDGAYSPVTD